MTEDLKTFAIKAIGRKRLFLRLSIAGVAVGFGLVAYYLYLWAYSRVPEAELAGRVASGAVIVTLILLNARQNLRQYKYAQVLESLMPRAQGGG